MENTLKELSSKYSGNLPRYTSYPTALEFQPITDPNLIFEKYQNIFDQYETFSYYLHLPFCPSLCYFCACNKIVTQDPEIKLEYLHLIQQELSLLKQAFQRKTNFKQVHLGGGSPSYLTCSEFDKLNNLLTNLLPGYVEAEKSIEIDPRTTTLEKLKIYLQAGFHRISLGVQDFDPKVQALINREQPFDLTRKIYDSARNLGARGINLDLIYGLPSQTLDSQQATLAKVLELRPDRIALYGYAHVNWKVKVQNVFNKHPLPSPELRIAMFAEAVKTLEAAGYIYIGLDHFALPTDDLVVALSNGKLRRNFMGYTTVNGEIQIANGVSGISDLNLSLLQNEVSLDEYHKKIKAGILPTAKIIERSAEDSLRAWAIEQIMCQRILKRQEFKEFNKALSQLADEIFSQALHKLDSLAKDQLVELDSDLIKVTPLGSFFLRNIAVFFDNYYKSAVAPLKYSKSI